MANEKNIIPHQFTSNQDREAAARNGRKGGKACAAAKRRKANMRKIAQTILDGTYKIDGAKLTGEEIARNGIIANLMNPNSKNWSKAIDLLIMLTGANMNEEQKSKIKSEAQLAKAKAKAVDPTQMMSTVKDNFIEALDGTANEDWEEENETNDIEDDI